MSSKRNFPFFEGNYVHHVKVPRVPFIFSTPSSSHGSETPPIIGTSSSSGAGIEPPPPSPIPGTSSSSGAGIGGGAGTDNSYESQYIEVKKRWRTFNKKYQVYDTFYKFTFRNNLPENTREELLHAALKELTEYAKRTHEGYTENRDILRIIIDNPRLNNPVSSKFECPDPVEDVLQKLMAILTSDETISKYFFSLERFFFFSSYILICKCVGYCVS